MHDRCTEISFGGSAYSTVPDAAERAHSVTQKSPDLLHMSSAFTAICGSKETVPGAHSKASRLVPYSTSYCSGPAFSGGCKGYKALVCLGCSSGEKPLTLSNTAGLCVEIQDFFPSTLNLQVQ